MPDGIKNFFLNGNEIIQGLLVGKIVSGGVIQMRTNAKALIDRKFFAFLTNNRKIGKQIVATPCPCIGWNKNHMR